MLDLVFQNYTTDKKLGKSFFKKILATAVGVLSSQPSTINHQLSTIGLSLNLVGAGRIKELNKKHRGKNKVTDVLSFPMSYGFKIHDSRSMIQDDAGDIFICLPFAKKEAKKENISIERKLAQLTVHGFLHLVGYDHETSRADAEKMFELENKILKSVPKLTSTQVLKQDA